MVQVALGLFWSVVRWESPLWVFRPSSYLLPLWVAYTSPPAMLVLASSLLASALLDAKGKRRAANLTPLATGTLVSIVTLIAMVSALE